MALFYAVAVAAMYAHPKANLKSGFKTVNERFDLAKAHIPYYNIRGRNLARERERGARLLRILNKNITQDMLKVEDARAEASGKIDIGQ